jgi:hypothetical protein
VKGPEFKHVFPPLVSETVSVQRSGDADAAFKNDSSASGGSCTSAWPRHVMAFG